MTATLLRMYEQGAITADHLVVESLRTLDPENPGLVLANLSDDLLQRVLKYAWEYRPGMMRTNFGRQPNLEQVQAAKNWIWASKFSRVIAFDPPGGEIVLRFIQERSGEIQKAVIPHYPHIMIVTPGRNMVGPVLDAGMLLYMSDGTKMILSPQEAEIVLNDAILNRLKIRIELYK